MGADTGVDHCYYPEVEKAFQHLVEEALYDHGHSGYTGSIAEARGYVVVDRKIRLLDDAVKVAWEIADTAEKWGPALALPFVSTRRRVDIMVPQYDHPLDYRRVPETLEVVALAEVRRQRKLRRGEKITKAPEIRSYQLENHQPGSRPTATLWQRRSDVRMTVYIDRAKSALTPEALKTAEPDGWVFVGCYSC